MATSTRLVSTALSDTLKLLGFKELRAKQEEVIRSFVKGNNVFVSLPTGSGKSLCYWVLPFVFSFLRKRTDSIVIVVSPLVALMKDQVNILEKFGVKAVYVGGTNTAVGEVIKQGQFNILFFSPECLLTQLDWRDMLHSPVYQEQLVAFVIDEAHCVKKWGVNICDDDLYIEYHYFFCMSLCLLTLNMYILCKHIHRGKDFRQEFSNLGEVRSLIPEDVRCMALTATATKTSRNEICNVLGMHKPVVVSQSPNKPNIKYCVQLKHGTMEETFAPLVEELKR